MFNHGAGQSLSAEQCVLMGFSFTICRCKDLSWSLWAGTLRSQGVGGYRII